MLADTGTMNINDHKGTNSKLSYLHQFKHSENRKFRVNLRFTLLHTYS